jgi:enamine deaminase RidA (YjgF/YER057c/UK114 family)
MDHFRLDVGPDPASVHVSRFAGASGVVEYHLSVRPTECGSIHSQLQWLQDGYRRAIEELGLDPQSAVFRRFFCSDLPNQAEALEACPCSSRDATDEPCAVSWVCQPPAPAVKVALWAYHLSDPAGELDKIRRNGSLTLRRGRLGHRWTTGLVSPNGSTTYDQTRGVFEAYDAQLRADDLTLADSVLRTWLFVRNIDTNYRDMVVARRELFAEHGLTPETHYIASSGIEGGSDASGAKVALDAYAISGVQPDQVSYPAALDHLCPTHSYGVTFERATSVAYRDRTQMIVSGTASIDSEGRILHAGDVSRQLDRTLDNVEALLARVDATLDDMGVFIVYLRDPGDDKIAWRHMRQRVGEAPIQVVVAPVCRPGWLIEVEGVAVVRASNPDLPEF